MMPIWAEAGLLFLVILGMLVGLFGLLLVFFPGITVIWVSILVWAIATGFNYSAGAVPFTLTVAIFTFITALMVTGNIVDNLLMAGGARKDGASWWAIGLSWVGMIAASLLLQNPFIGLAAALLILFIFEWIRVKKLGAAWASTRGMMMGCGWAVFARFGIGLLMIALFIIWYFLLYHA